MSIFLGFNEQQMLYWIGKYCKTVELSKINGAWRLYTFSDKYGEFEQEGSIFRILSAAFKPFLDQAKEQQEKAQAEIEKIIPSFKKAN